MARIAVDCDGVLARFEKAFLEMANSMWPGHVDPSHRPQAWDDFDGLTKDEMNRVWAKIDETPNWWLSLDPYTENVGALASFLTTEKNHDIHIVTSRRAGAGMTIAQQTLQWLFSCGVHGGHNYLGVIPVEFPSQKARLYTILGVQYSIDDKGETVVQCDTLDDHQAFLLDREWNRHVTPKHRVNSLDQFFSSIKGDPK